MVETKRLKPPSDIVRTVEKEARRVEAFLRENKIAFDDERLDRVERDVAKKYDSWEKQTQGLRRNLVEWNDLLEGVVEETNFPFEGASNLTLHYAAAEVAAFRSQFNASRFQDPNIFTAVGPDSNATAYTQDDLNALEDAQNYTFHTECNGLDTLKDSIIPVQRDGTIIIQGSWERRLERTNDSRFYSSDVAFKTDYPDAESAGMAQDAYDAILDQFMLDDEFELHALFSYDFVAQDSPEYEIVSLSNFVFWPTFAPSIKRMELYGSRYYISQAELETESNRGNYYKERAEQVKAHYGEQSGDAWSASRAFIEGLAAAQEEKKPIQVCDLVYKADLDDDGIQEKYLLVYAVKSRKVLRMEEYPLRRNVDICVDFRLIRRDGRFLGVSLLGDTSDLFRFKDAIHNHRNNVRMIATAPIFLVQKELKEQGIDLGSGANVFRPGLTFYVPDPSKSISQLAVQNLDQPGNSMDEEQILDRHIELRFGPTQGLSGRESQSDPNAPMGKTLALMRQANMRIDDYGDEFARSIPAMGELHASLYSQYGPSSLSFTINRGGKPAKRTIERSVFGIQGIKWQAKRRSVTMSPEFVMQRIGGLTQTYASLLPLLQMGDPVAQELWNRMVRASGEPDEDKLMSRAQPAPVLPGPATPGAPSLPNPSLPPNPAMAARPNGPLVQPGAM